jgi:hypothetical protein
MHPCCGCELCIAMLFGYTCSFSQFGSFGEVYRGGRTALILLPLIFFSNLALSFQFRWAQAGWQLNGKKTPFRWFSKRAPQQTPPFPRHSLPARGCLLLIIRHQQPGPALLRTDKKLGNPPFLTQEIRAIVGTVSVLVIQTPLKTRPPTHVY